VEEVVVSRAFQAYREMVGEFVQAEALEDPQAFEEDLLA
jgi:hypothetical protein